MTHEEQLQFEFEKETGELWYTESEYNEFDWKVPSKRYLEWLTKRALTNEQVNLLESIISSYIIVRVEHGLPKTKEWLDGIKTATINNTESLKCPECQGNGRVPAYPNTVPCPECRGTGKRKTK
jgi:hypothetical protein